VYQPGDDVYIKECVTEDGPQPALIGTVIEDHGECVEVRLWRVVTDVPGMGDVVQWTDPEDEVQDFLHEFLVPIKKEQ
jgi:hypothetical protein